jgi:hypothetical protein
VEHFNTHSKMSNARTLLVVLKLKDGNWMCDAIILKSIFKEQNLKWKVDWSVSG